MPNMQNPELWGERKSWLWNALRYLWRKWDVTDLWPTQEREVEALEEELAQCRADLKLAFKRISDLQAALEEELDSDEDSLQLGDRYNMFALYTGPLNGNNCFLCRKFHGSDM